VLEWRDEVGSTHEVLVAAARDGAGPRALATTSQPGGRGRRGRTWECPPGSGVALSVLLRPARSDGWTWVPLAAGVAVARVLVDLGAPDAVLKWPNDVLARGGKLAGLLAERVEHGPSPAAARPALVVGVGLNLRTDGLPAQAVALDALTGEVRHGAPAVAAAVLQQLGEVVARWEHGEDAWLAEAYRHRCATLGAGVRVSLPDGTALTGRAVDVDDAGRLVVQPPSGPAVRLSAGDVAHVRPDGAPRGD
jgi:BirA family biotin operon repressor/biotin-[acetyl-CoA-carboxylase] ligase